MGISQSSGSYLVKHSNTSNITWGNKLPKDKPFLFISWAQRVFHKISKAESSLQEKQPSCSDNYYSALFWPNLG